MNGCSLEPEVIRRLAHAAADAYEPPDASLQLKDNLGRNRGFMRWGGDGPEIHISGTQSLRDMLIDTRCWKMRWFLKDPKPVPQEPFHESGCVHAGFLREFEQIQGDVFDYVLSNPKRVVRISGHSLGGAIATLLAVELAKDGFQVELVTLGSPRVGDREFRKTYEALQNIDHVRIVHQDDIVPRLPKLNYEHVCAPLHLDENGRVMGKVRGFFRWLWFADEILLSDLDGRSVRDHGVIGYLVALERFLDPTNGGGA